MCSVYINATSYFKEVLEVQAIRPEQHAVPDTELECRYIDTLRREPSATLGVLREY